MIGRANLPFLSKNRDYEKPVTSWTNVKAGTNITGNQIAFTATNSGATSTESFEFGKTGRIQLLFTTKVVNQPNEMGGGTKFLKIGLIPATGTIANFRGFGLSDDIYKGTYDRVIHNATQVYNLSTPAKNGTTYAIELSADDASYMQNNVTVFTSAIANPTPMKVVLENALPVGFKWTISDIVVRGI